jgi:hypothetical protein
MPSSKGDAKQVSASREDDPSTSAASTRSPTCAKSSTKFSRSGSRPKCKPGLPSGFSRARIRETPHLRAPSQSTQKNAQPSALQKPLRPIALQLGPLRLIPMSGQPSQDSSRRIHLTPTRKGFRLDAPLVIPPPATPLPATPLRVTLLLAPPLAREIAPRASSPPNQEVVHPSHAPRLPVVRRIFQPSCTRARPANPQQFQNPARQARCSSHFAARIETK